MTQFDEIDAVYQSRHTEGHVVEPPVWVQLAAAVVEAADGDLHRRINGLEI